MKLGEVIFTNVYYNFTKFHQNQMKNKKVLLIARFSVQNFKVSVELWKSYIVDKGWWYARIHLNFNKRKLVLKNDYKAKLWRHIVAYFKWMFLRIRFTLLISNSSMYVQTIFITKKTCIFSCTLRALGWNLKRLVFHVKTSPEPGFPGGDTSSRLHSILIFL